MVTTVNPGIFKAYDIRGLYGDDIDAASAQLIGRAFVRVIAELEGKPPRSCAWRSDTTCA